MGKKSKIKTPDNIFSFIDNHVQALNGSKIFAGLMIITLNIVSRFANIKLSKTLEAYFKYSFSRQILIFAIAWMGTRDIYIALFITICFVIITEVFFHEESQFFMFTEEFRDYHIDLLDNEKVTDDDVKRAQDVLDKAKKQKLIGGTEYQGFSLK